MKNIKISSHALKQYCMRKYDNRLYHLEHREVVDEVRNNLNSAYPSKHKSKEFLMGYKTKDCILLENDDFIFVVRDNTLITVLSVPCTDKIFDFFLQSKNR